MLLKNYGTLVSYCLTPTSTFNKNNFINTKGSFMTASIALEFFSNTTFINKEEYDYTGSSASTGGFSFCFGDGDIPPTADDYKLSGEFLNENFTGSTGRSGGTAGTVYTCRLTNTSEAPVTIKELGLAMYRTRCECVLLTRDVLEEPVIIPVGGVTAFEISIDTMSFITNTK